MALDIQSAHLTRRTPRLASPCLDLVNGCFAASYVHGPFCSFCRDFLFLFVTHDDRSLSPGLPFLPVLFVVHTRRTHPTSDGCRPRIFGSLIHDSANDADDLR
jgi:hypothetical protein